MLKGCFLSNKENADSQADEPHDNLGSSDLGFAPEAPTDGRKLYDWKSRWPEEARKYMRAEFFYLILILVGPCIALALNLMNKLNMPPEILGALAGISGGAAFAVKWFYHSIAKGLWHLDRCYWRIITPIVSGVIAFFSAILVRSDLLNIFNLSTFAKPSNIIILGFVAGYFSDSAIAKFAEVAASLFGQTSFGKKKSD
jgi:ABC-type Fe3+-siderophore transport system permease subunit